MFLAQVQGAKQWAAWTPVIRDPLETDQWINRGFTRQDRDRIDGPPDFTATIAAGDVLYLPRGWVHSGHTTTDHSFHLTIGVHLQTWHSLLRDLAIAAAEDPAIRGALPPGLARADPDVLGSTVHKLFSDWVARSQADLIRRLIRLPGRG
ncbi:JmjC domain-containing protein [Yinghuangia sp. YIM S09857]|uniref:JmjC domain-containing protein n=1 Tax=Yinghuangia sp. YIM S09857 TaxID=3436929 RepID=UPI003F52B1A1